MIATVNLDYVALSSALPACVFVYRGDGAGPAGTAAAGPMLEGGALSSQHLVPMM